MRKERKDIALGAIQLNTGQVDWLPANPRTWTQSDIDDTRDSILEDPDFLEDRPLLVVPFGKAFVAFAGNLRHEGATAAKLSKVPCVVYHPETAADYETILRRAMKDNGQFGKTNWDAIYSSKWGTLPLEKWGLTPKGWTEPEGGEGNMPGAEGGEGGKMPQAHEDDFNEDEDAIKVRCKPGDIWQLGEHRLMCGDSIDLEQVKKLTGGQKLIYRSHPRPTELMTGVCGNTKNVETLITRPATSITSITIHRTDGPRSLQRHTKT